MRPDVWTSIQTIHPPHFSHLLLVRPYLNCFEQEAEFLISALASDHLRPPSTLPYNFSRPVEEVPTSGQFGQPDYIDEVLFKGQVHSLDWLLRNVKVCREKLFYLYLLDYIDFWI